MISGVAGLRPNFFLQRPNFLADLAQESWRDLAAVAGTHFSVAAMLQVGACVLSTSAPPLHLLHPQKRYKAQIYFTDWIMLCYY